MCLIQKTSQLGWFFNCIKIYHQQSSALLFINTSFSDFLLVICRHLAIHRVKKCYYGYIKISFILFWYYWFLSGAMIRKMVSRPFLVKEGHWLTGFKLGWYKI